MSDIEHTNTSLSQKFGMSKLTRWMDFSDYGMSLKLAKYERGDVLVMENGGKHSGNLFALGFRETDGEWVRADVTFLPRSFMSIFPDAKVVVDMEIKDVVLDRSNTVIPGYPEQEAIKSFSEKVQAAVKHQPDEMPKVQVWIAEFEFGDHIVQAFGIDPEQAMKALVEAWTDQATLEREEVSAIVDFREGVKVNPAQIGKGYARGMGDNFWYKGGINGDDSRFDEIFSEIPKASPNRAMRY